MASFARERRDAFLDAYVRLSIIASVLTIIQYDAWPFALPASSFRTAAYFFCHAFQLLFGITSIILALYAIRYFRRQGFDKKTLVLPGVFLVTMIVLFAMVLLAIAVELIWHYDVPKEWNPPLLIAEIAVNIFLLFYALSLRKAIKPVLAPHVTRALCTIFGGFLIGATVSTLTVRPPFPSDQSLTGLAATLVGILVEVAAVWYAIRTIKRLQLPTKSSR